MMFAQADLGSVPANFIKDLIIFGVAMLVLVAFLVSALFAGLQYFQSRRAEGATTKTQIFPSPLEVDATVKSAPKRFNKDFEDLRHTEIDRRLSLHDLELERLRAADTVIRAEVASKFDAISHALGRIEGKMQ